MATILLTEAPHASGRKMPGLPISANRNIMKMLSHKNVSTVIKVMSRFLS
jgi:hypothetical protein